MMDDGTLILILTILRRNQQQSACIFIFRRLCVVIHLTRSRCLKHLTMVNMFQKDIVEACSPPHPPEYPVKDPLALALDVIAQHPFGFQFRLSCRKTDVVKRGFRPDG